MPEEPPPPQNPDPSAESIGKSLDYLEEHLLAPKGTLRRLFVDDDWSFIIKAHALLESSISSLLASHLDPRLRETFALLELGKEATGKLEFTKVLEILSPGERGFVRIFSALRNKLAHDTRYLSFDLKVHVASLKKEQRKAFVDGVTHDVVPEHRDAWIKILDETPRIALLGTLIRFLLRIMVSVTSAMWKKQDDAFFINYGREILKEFDPDAPELQAKVDIKKPPS
jgi:hypothetical protein